MVVKKTKGGYYISSSVGGYRFSRTYTHTNRTCAISKHLQMMGMASRWGDRWIDQPLFNDYE